MLVAGPLATLVLCELCKLLTKWQMKRYQRQLKLQTDEGLSDSDVTSYEDSTDSDIGRSRLGRRGLGALSGR